MKLTIGRVLSCRNEGNYNTLITENGSIILSRMGDSIVSVEYKINGYATPEHLQMASDYLIGDYKEQTIPSFVCDGEKYSLKIGKSDIEIDSNNGNIEVIKDGESIFGGVLGNSDTVISHEQFRLLGHEESPFARYSWPLKNGECFYGLGDKSGDPNHAGKRFRMYNRDSLGYDAEYSDPLYKSVPFFIKHKPQTNSAIGLYFPESHIECFDFGKECPIYFSTDIVGGPFRYFIILGDDYKDIIANYCLITGRPNFPPLYSFGYLGSSMNYVEAYDAQQRMEKFFQDTEDHNLPCEGLYVSSGYLKADDGKRYSFFWNRRKFPDPKQFISSLVERGYHLTFNIKPGILLTHPWYEELKEKGYFVKDNDGNPIVEFFWGGNASFIDFANPKAKAWWKNKLYEAYIAFGAEGIWNDNNELELEDTALKAFDTRTLYPVLMVQASYEELLKHNPDKRPWIYSRSGYAGLQRYARTWTGDNTSTFKTLKYNQFQGMSLALSGMPYVGHDLGGFYGDEPSDELLIRSAQSAVFQCRFVIHSWREDDKPTEPWKDAKTFPYIKAAIEDHYRHIPYIYNCAYEASQGYPIERLLALEYPQDTNLCTMSSVSLFGPSVLKALVVNEGQTSVEVHFPQCDDWYSPFEGKFYTGGTCKTFEAPLDKYWYFYKVGSVIPKSKHVGKLNTGFFKELQFFIVPKDGNFTYPYFEDDGTTRLEKNLYNLWKIFVSYDKTTGKGSVDVKAKYIGSKETLKGRSVEFAFPCGFVTDNKVVAFSELDGYHLDFAK